DGRYRAVLAEHHIFVNTLENEVFRWSHPAPTAWQTAMRAAFPRGRVAVAPPERDAVRQISHPWSAGHGDDLCIVFPGSTDGAGPDRSTARLGELSCWRVDRDVVLGRPGGAPLCTLVDALAPAAGIGFAMFSSVRHLPRITIGDMVLRRERWDLSLDGLRGAMATTDPAAAF